MGTVRLRQNRQVSPGERQKLRGKNSLVHVMRKMGHRHRSASGCLFLSCTASCTVMSETCRISVHRKGSNVPDGRDERLVSAFVAAWYDAMCVNKIKIRYEVK